MKIPQLKVLLFRCHSCGYLITCNDIVLGNPCNRCESVYRRLATKFTIKEEIRILWLWITGKLLRTLPGAE